MPDSGFIFKGILSLAGGVHSCVLCLRERGRRVIYLLNVLHLIEYSVFKGRYAVRGDRWEIMSCKGGCHLVYVAVVCRQKGVVYLFCAYRTTEETRRQSWNANHRAQRSSLSII